MREGVSIVRRPLFFLWTPTGKPVGYSDTPLHPEGWFILFYTFTGNLFFFRCLLTRSWLMREDLALIKDVLNNRSKALETLYDRYAPALLSLCFRYAGNMQDAEDILHDGFIKVIRNLSSFEPRPDSSLEAWMKKIMTNTALNFLRDHAKERKQVDIDRIGERMIFSDDDPVEFDLAHLPVSQDQILQFIAELPAGYRTVFNLYVFEEYSHKEIGERLNCSENTSKSQLSKARALLRARISEKVNIYNFK